MQLFFLITHYFWKEKFDTFDNQCDVLRAASCDSRDVFRRSESSLIDNGSWKGPDLYPSIYNKKIKLSDCLDLSRVCYRSPVWPVQCRMSLTKLHLKSKINLHCLNMYCNVIWGLTKCMTCARYWSYHGDGLLPRGLPCLLVQSDNMDTADMSVFDQVSPRFWREII